MILKLFVDKDAIKLDQKEEPASDSREVLYCKFRFTHDWDGYVKHVLLWTDKDQVRRDVQLDESSTCLVPQALIASGQHHLFLTVYGLKANERHTAAFFAILIRDSGYEDDSEPLTTLDIDIDGAGAETYDVSSYTYAEVNVPQGSVSIPSPTITANPVMSVDNNGKVVAAVSTSETVTPTVEEGWVSSAQSGQVNVSGSGQLQLDSWAGRTITPTEQAQVAVPEHKYTLGEVNIGPIPPEYIVPEGTIEITQNGTYDIGEYDEAEVNIPGGSAPVLQTKSATPTETAQTVTADQGYDGLGQVNVGAISSTYVGSEVPQLDADDVNVVVTDNALRQRATIQMPVGYIPSAINKVYTEVATFSTGSDVHFYTDGDLGMSFSADDPGMAYMNKTYTIRAANAFTNRYDSDMTVSGNTVTAPAGYYRLNSSKTVASGTEGTPAATKGTVSNHQVSVTPSVTNAEGYISGGTHTGTPVTVTAAELVSGAISINQNGQTDVTNYATANVNVPIESSWDDGTVTLSRVTASISGTTVTLS